MHLLQKTPCTPGIRHQKNINKSQLVKNSKLIKQLLFSIQNCTGHSTLTGHTTVFHRGGGHKQKYRPLTFFNRSLLGILLFTAYDPNRTAFIYCGFDFFKKTFFTSIAGENMPTGSIITFRERFDFSRIHLGYRLFLSHMPHGSTFFGLQPNISNSNRLFLNAPYARSAGVFCQLIQRNASFCIIKLPSGFLRKVFSNAIATIGGVSNEKHCFSILGKAGRNRNLGHRPHVRGVAMNPIDHPHGGRTKPGRPSVTPWGRPALGYKTKRH